MLGLLPRGLRTATPTFLARRVPAPLVGRVCFLGDRGISTPSLSREVVLPSEAWEDHETPLQRSDEGRAAAFYGFAVGSDGHVQIAIYFDRESDLRLAREIWRSLREQRPG